MTIKANDGLVPAWYTPKIEEDNNEQATQFFLQPLTGPQLLDVQPHFDLEKMTVRGPGLVIALRYGLKGWKNLTNREGVELPFAAASIDFLPSEIIAELGGEIIRVSTLDEDDIKNS